jgi:putative DNA primase/helicase
VVWKINFANSAWMAAMMDTITPNIELDPTTPLNTAYAIVETRYTVLGIATLRYYCGEFFHWTGTHYELVDSNTMRSHVYSFMDSADCPAKNGTTSQFTANSRRVTEVIDALKAVTNIPSKFQSPSWLSGNSAIAPADVIACKNGLLNSRTRELYQHTPDFFNLTMLPYDYNPQAAPPLEWISFLSSLWGLDAAAIGTLQEVMGYLLTSDTSQQKIFALIGPTRAGKGVIARIVSKLLGTENVANPTLASLTTNFGLEPLIGKQVAIISDARLGTRSDQQVIAERLLSVSGEDGLTIDRKHRVPWTGRLPARFFILSNEIPRLGDASGALAKRFVMLVLKRTFYGREDHGLEPRLSMELPGILNWALDGRDRLVQRGRFEQPASSTEVIQELEDLGSPISAFLRERCDIGEGYSVDADKLYNDWRSWCLINGRDHPGNAQSFGRDLRASLSEIKVSQPRDGASRKRVYSGLRLKQ